MKNGKMNEDPNTYCVYCIMLLLGLSVQCARMCYYYVQQATPVQFECMLDERGRERERERATGMDGENERVAKAIRQ